MMMGTLGAAFALKWFQPVPTRPRPIPSSAVRMTTITTAACFVLVGLIGPALGAGSFGDMKGYDAGVFSAKTQVSVS